MRFVVLAIVAVALCASLGISARAEDKGKGSVLDFKMKSLDGKDTNLADYKGKVVMIVNVASRCGLTPQYEALQGLHDKYSKDGFVIVGVPANDFLGQEPGTNDEIAKFCESKYHVKFPMLGKVAVTGSEQTPLYKYLTSKETNPKFSGSIKWNFTKFVVGKNGELVARFEPRTKPDSKEVVEVIEAELKK